ncbi:hypothetical protein K435DRAFT_974387 [Dendrothele bispora CBS 962.96]|uniref:Uncharacterized protein n=1 Tax=Dendrothele bispora (strain CBS 962.96) TaxID=1314807 RepID=A0A4S8KMV2_DENBC|nr:hypothetical protein K435DRAFT_974387 [Dendrothele bispora CBS 962.96]
MFSSSLPFLSLLSFFSFVIPSIVEVHAAINVTVDNSDPGILYRPLGSWSLDDSYDSGATDHFTGDQDAWAAFNFTGIAVYYLVHLYPSSLPTGGMISLDGGPAVAVTMWNPDRDSYGRQWETVWSAANLTNTTHMLNVSWWPNQLNQFISLDTIMYTIDNETDATSAGSAQPTASGADFGSSTTSSSNNTVPIVYSSSSNYEKLRRLQLRILLR